MLNQSYVRNYSKTTNNTPKEWLHSSWFFFQTFWSSYNKQLSIPYVTWTCILCFFLICYFTGLFLPLDHFDCCFSCLFSDKLTFWSSHFWIILLVIYSFLIYLMSFKFSSCFRFIFLADILAFWLSCFRMMQIICFFVLDLFGLCSCFPFSCFLVHISYSEPFPSRNHSLSDLSPDHSSGLSK